MGTNHVAIAQREANAAHAAAQSPEAAYDVYRKVYEATLARLERAEVLLAAGAVSANGANGQYRVKSQSDNGRCYLVRVERAGGALCNCADFRNRGFKCKHVLAAELYEDRQRIQRPRPVLLGGRKMYHAPCGHALWVEEKMGAILYKDVYANGAIQNCPTCGERLRIEDLREHLGGVR